MVIKYISLGPNCQTSGMIKAVGYKTESYPFDWVLTNLDIVLDCIESDFKHYLDKQFYFKNESYTSQLIIGHKKYTDNMFVHRDPLSLDEDYSYIKRCVERFLKLYESDAEIYLVYTAYSNNIQKEKLLKLLELLRGKNMNCHIVIYNYVKSNEAGYKIERIEDMYCVTIDLVYNETIEYDIDRAITEFHKKHNTLLEIEYWKINRIPRLLK